MEKEWSLPLTTDVGVIVVSRVCLPVEHQSEPPFYGW